MLTPLILITISYVFGILFGNAFQISIIFTLAGIIVTMICSAAVLLKGGKVEYLLFLLIFLFGMIAFQFHGIIPANDISHFAEDRYVRITGSVVDEPSLSDNLTKMTLNAN